MPTYRELGAAEARIALDACLEDLARRGKAATIAVADGHGELIALWRMDGASLPSIVIAGNKAYTAARVRADSGDMGRGVKASGDDVHYHGDSRYVGWDGGAVVMHNGECLGSVAVSGLSGEEDLAIAHAGVAAILKSLG
jgi:glc operon protein GlcG